ncbi:hypothetical protein [Pseudooceanicola sp.]|uniref:hypothetical protein n=1 Tax=Pseudooceanicola sp. TaxID=1914328 RepID=UPI0035C71D71
MRKPTYSEIPRGFKAGLNVANLTSVTPTVFTNSTVITFLAPGAGEDGANFITTNSVAIPDGSVVAFGLHCAVDRELQEAYFVSMNCVVDKDFKVIPFVGSKETDSLGQTNYVAMLGGPRLGGNEFSGALRYTPTSLPYLNANPTHSLVFGMLVYNASGSSLTLGAARCSIDVTRFDGVKDIKVAY